MKTRLNVFGVALCACLFFAGISAFAQSTPEVSISLYSNPDLPDTMGSPSISIGSAEDPAVELVSIEFTIHYDVLLDINDFELEGEGWSSFLNPDGLFAATLTHDPLTKTIEVLLERTDLVGQSGYGEVMRFGGVGIIDNIDLKQRPVISALTTEVIPPRFEQNRILIADSQADWAEIRGLDGALLMRKVLVEGEHSLEIDALPNGLYLLVLGGKTSQVYKFQHLQ